ncbi:MAG: glutamate-1-semialdehyde 2,1-aminomutase [Bdellovibrionota bacterium]
MSEISKDDWSRLAEKVFVGGVNSPVRSFKRVGGNPILAKSAKGAFIEDVEGKKYVDLVMSYGPHLFGHHYEPIISSLKENLEKGLCFGMTGEQEILWGEKILSFLPAKWKVRALNSGTEACMTAVRLARGHTGREVVVKCSGHYHGHVDSLLFDAGSGLATLSDETEPDSAGLPKALAECLKVIPFNDIEALQKVFAQFSDQIAGIIFEPVMGNMGVVLPDQAFLNEARLLTKKHGALLIFDEVMTGFRVAKNSSFGRFDVTPDLICFGKIVGGGLPLAALAGPQEVLETLAPVGKVYQAGTLSGNPLGMSAGLAMLKEIEKLNPYPQLEALGADIESLTKETLSKKGIPASVLRCGSMMSLHFRKEAPKNASDTRDVDHNLFSRYFWKAIENGLMLPPSPFEAYFLSMAHLPVKGELMEKIEKTLNGL